MNKLLIIFTISALGICSCKKYPSPSNDKEFDNGSRIVLSELTTDKYNDLKILGLVWGFLKYYHPNIAAGKFNWDYELFRILPQYIKAENQNVRDKILYNWINQIGKFKTKKSNSSDEQNLKLKPDLGWINQSNFSPELVVKLNEVKHAKRNGRHYYVGFNANVKNPVFKNENKYSTMKYPDTGFRILSLFRYWNIIQYYFPYKNLIEKDWKDVLPEFLPQFIEAENEIEYKLSLLKLIGQVHDTHAQLYGPDKNLSAYLGGNYAKVRLSIIEGKAVIVGFFDDNIGKQIELEIGDIVTKIDNKTIEEIIRENLELNPASNHPTQLRNLSTKLLRTRNDSINIEIIRNDELFLKRLEAFPMDKLSGFQNQKHDTCFKMLTPQIAYINNGTLRKEFIPELWKKIETTDGLIIDIRNYPSDFPIYNLSNYLMPQSIPFVKFTNGSVKTPGLFKFGKSLSIGKKREDFYKGKLVILVNERTQSSAEFHAMAYQKSPNSIIIGSTTAGADGNVSQFYLPGGVKTMISGIGVYYPDGTETQRIGIVPDIEIKPTIQGIREGKDEILERAIELITKRE